MTDQPTPTPCTCTHAAADHTPLSGCLEEVNGSWCPCAQYVPDPAQVTTPDTPRLSATEGRAQGKALRDEGTARAGSGVPAALAEAWRAKARLAIDTMAKDGTTVFSADDVVDQIGPPPVPAMLGAIFLAASRSGSITPVGYVTASRPSAHGRPQRTWRGVR